MGVGKPLNAKLFLEGMEVPLIGATVTHSVNQAAIAYIDIVPHETINNIKPRTHVLLTIRDFNDPHNSRPFPYIEMFEGEVFGFSFSKDSDKRSMTLSCIDKSGYWDNALIYYFNAMQALGKGADTASASGQDFNDASRITGGKGTVSVSFSSASFFKQIMQGTFQNGGDFLDGIVNLYKKFQDVNSFYALAEDRLRITDRIRLRSSGALKNLLQEKESLDWFEGMVGKASGFQTLRMVMQDLMSIIFHDGVTVPFPAKVALNEGEKLTGGDPIKSKSDADKTIGEFIFKPNLYMFPPPTCNIFYPDEYSSFQYSRNFFQEPTRLIYRPELPMAFNQGGNVALPHVYEPESFEHFMLGTGDEDQGDGPLQVTKSQGRYGDKGDTTIPNAEAGKREGQFLTNEELMKGIIMTIESMVPASSQFRASLKELGRADLYQKVAAYLFYKKRFENRSLQITSHLKPSVVPGFPVLILDASDANHSVIAYCSSVTHRVYATQGGYTNVQLSYARTPGEQDQISDNEGEPPIPPWFDASVFGASEGGESTTSTFPAALSEFYSDLLGQYGAFSITDDQKVDNVEDAVKGLIKEYRSALSKNASSIPDLIADKTARDYVYLREAFNFVGAGTSSKDLTLPWQTFSGYRFTGNAAGNPTNEEATEGAPDAPDDAPQVRARRKVVIAYRNALRNNRGFRG